MSAEKRLKEADLQKIKEMYLAGESYESIAQEVHICPQTVGYRISKMAKEGKIELRKIYYHPPKVKEVKKKVVKEKPKRVMHEGKKCDAAFCKTCVYHNGDQGKWLCNYAEIEHKTRVNRDNNSFKGNMWECREYVKIDKEHPWKRIGVQEPKLY